MTAWTGDELDKIDRLIARSTTVMAPALSLPWLARKRELLRSNSCPARRHRRAVFERAGEPDWPARHLHERLAETCQTLPNGTAFT